MGCGVTCARFFLILFTALLSLVGFAILTAGLLCKFGSQTVLKPFFDQAVKGIENLRKTLPSSSSNNTTTVGSGTNGDDVLSTLEPIAVILISFGSVIAALSLVGFFGACCKNKCLLYLYALFVTIIGLALVILSSIILSGAANVVLEKEFLKTIENNYCGLDGKDSGSLVWNFIMIQFNCCGLHGYEDFNMSRHWNREVTFENHTVILATPVACCKMNGTFPNVTPSHEKCAIDPSDDISNWKRGCWKEVTSYVLLYKPYIALAIAGILLIEAFVVLWSCVVANKMNQVCPV